MAKRRTIHTPGFQARTSGYGGEGGTTQPGGLSRRWTGTLGRQVSEKLLRPFVPPRGLCYGPDARLSGCGPLGRKEMPGADSQREESLDSQDSHHDPAGDIVDLQRILGSNNEVIDLTGDSESEDMDSEEAEEYIKIMEQLRHRGSSGAPCRIVEPPRDPEEPMSEGTQKEKTPDRDATVRSSQSLAEPEK